MRLGKIGGLLFGTLALGAGLFALTWGIQGVLASLASKDWPTAEGTVTQSELEKQRKKGGAASTQRRNRFTYTPRVTYEFSVEGKSYTGTRLSFSDYATSNEEQMQQVIAPYPVGTSVTVYYDPDKPTECALQTGFGWTPVAVTGAGCILTFIGSIALVGAIRRKC